MKKVFTKVLGLENMQIVTGLQEYVLDSWVAQEDELILGFTYDCGIKVMAENDGIAYAILDLTQAGQMFKDGSLGQVSVSEYWNTAPAFGEINTAQGSVFFEAGKEISLAEGDDLSLFVKMAGKTAGVSVWDVHITVYYIKQGR